MEASADVAVAKRSHTISGVALRKPLVVPSWMKHNHKFIVAFQMRTKVRPIPVLCVEAEPAHPDNGRPLRLAALSLNLLPRRLAAVRRAALVNLGRRLHDRPEHLDAVPFNKELALRARRE